MPRAKTACARTPGHGGDCMTATNMANRREYNRLHGHRQSPESRRRSNRKYRISSYGLSQEQFDRLLAAQQHAGGSTGATPHVGQRLWEIAAYAGGPISGLGRW